MGPLFRKCFLVATLVSVFAAGGALGMDKLVERDIQAFASFVLVREASLEAAIARRDVAEARNLAGRIHDEECRFLERVVRYLRDAKNPGAAGELETYLNDYRQVSLKDTVRMRRSAGPGRVPMVELATAALTGTRVPMDVFMLPPKGADPAPAPANGPGLPPGAPPGYPGVPPGQGIGTPVPSLPAQITTAKLNSVNGARTIRILKADLSDQDPELASTKTSFVSADTLRSHTGSGLGGKPVPAASVLESPAGDDSAMASSTRVPGAPSTSGSAGTSGGAGTNAAKSPALIIRAPAAPVSTSGAVRR